MNRILFVKSILYLVEIYEHVLLESFFVVKLTYVDLLLNIMPIFFLSVWHDWAIFQGEWNTKTHLLLSRCSKFMNGMISTIWYLWYHIIYSHLETMNWNNFLVFFLHQGNGQKKLFITPGDAEVNKYMYI